MATKPTIYKLRIALSDLERNYYDTLNLTIALHPSETPERMMARVMAYCINAQEGISFAKGLSDVDEPDIWIRTMDQQTSLWIDVGEPSHDRVKKASRQAKQVRVYSFNSKSDVWWDQGKSKFGMLKADIFRFNHSEIEALTELLARTMDLSVTITGQSAYVAGENGEVEVNWEILQSKT
ncbi:MAG: YaeQ family protein [Arenicella sp.]|nr:YaeQ family protein [Arenicella sp.]